MVVTAEVADMPLADRITPILEAVADYVMCGELRVETADGRAKELTTFCRKFSVPLRQALRGAGKLTKEELHRRPVLHVLFLANDRALVGYSTPSTTRPSIWAFRA